MNTAPPSLFGCKYSARACTDTVPAGATQLVVAVKLTSVGIVPSTIVDSHAPISAPPASKYAIFITTQFASGAPPPIIASPLVCCAIPSN